MIFTDFVCLCLSAPLLGTEPNTYTVAAWFWWPVCWPTALIQTKVDEQLFEKMTENLAHISTVSKRNILQIKIVYLQTSYDVS